MAHRTLTRAFTCYAGAVETVLAQRQWAARTMARRKTSCLKRAMEVWTENADMVRSERAREVQELAMQYMQDILNKQQEKAVVARDMESKPFRGVRLKIKSRTQPCLEPEARKGRRGGTPEKNKDLIHTTWCENKTSIKILFTCRTFTM
jgi:hypothetical protein